MRDHEMRAKITIGICVKDSEKTIKEAFDSVANQKYPKGLMQIIVVDGCSKDKTLSIVSSSASKAEVKVEIYSDQRKGLGAARQMVVDHAKGKYVVFVDADVRLLDDFVKSQVNFMDTNLRTGVAFGKPMHREGTLVSTIMDLQSYATAVIMGTEATIFRSKALKQVGGFDTNIKGAAEDRDIIVRIQAKGWQVSVNETASFFHKYRENLRDFWNEQSWFGYGDHYFNHKHKNTDASWHKLPFGVFIYGLRTASKAYELTHRKVSFLIPLQTAFGNTGWWFGFMKGHMDGYGHEMS
jgi:glycosyltransferase involved in cell wall biosynthesis